MMREIKFRAWDKDCEHMLSHKDLVSYLDDGSTLISQIFDNQMPDLVIMQYTGLKDKNGVEIYDGDVVSGFSGEVIGKITWSYEDAFYWIKTKSGGGQLCESYAENFEVIGNIHQNQELIND